MNSQKKSIFVHWQNLPNVPAIFNLYCLMVSYKPEMYAHVHSPFPFDELQGKRRMCPMGVQRRMKYLLYFYFEYKIPTKKNQFIWIVKLQSISSTLYVRIVRMNVIFILTYEKRARKTLMKLTPGLYLQSISSTFYTHVFLYESALLSFSLFTFWLCYYLAKNHRQKSTCKMLMKLTTNHFQIIIGSEIG